MAINTFAKQQISYDLASKDFITVDIGTSSTPNVIQIPVFKNNTQFKFINEGQTIYCPENYYYMDSYSQRWQNAPNVITMFVQDAVAIGVKPVVDGTGVTTYEPVADFNATQSETIMKAMFDYFSTNSGSVIYTLTQSPASANSVSSVTSNNQLTGSLKIINNYICKGLENSGTLSSFFKRPTDEEMNPSGIVNLAQGNYPYNSDNIITNYPINNWVGEWPQLFYSPSTTSTANAPGFDKTNGVFIDCVNIANEPFGSSSTSEKNISIPKFYEPIDYVFLYTNHNFSPVTRIYGLYRRVYFGVQPFNV